MGRTKALIGVDGVPMAVRVARALGEAGCTSVLAYGGDPGELHTLGLPILPDRYPGAGPLGGVLGVLELFDDAESTTTAVFVVACDLPCLTGSDLAPMIDASRAHPDVDVVVARTFAIEPACAIWRVSAIPRLREVFEAGERAIHAAIARLASIEVELDAGALRNINTPEELGGYP